MDLSKRKIFGNVKEIAYAFLPKARGQMRCLHFCAIYKKKRLISAAFNKHQTTPKNLKYNYKPNSALHAEMAAICKVGLDDFSGHSLYVMRIDRNDEVNSSRPCQGCEHLIRGLHFKEVYATGISGLFEKINY